MRRFTFVFALALVSCGGAVAPSGMTFSPPPHPFPSRFVGQTTDGRIVVARTADGSIEHVLSAGLTDEAQFEVPDDRSGVFVQRQSGCEPVRFFPVDGGGAREITRDIRRWSISPDGRSIAYVSDGDCHKMYPAGYEVTIRDLSTGSTRSWAFPMSQRNELIEADDVQWLHDTRYLYVWSCGADTCGPTLLDTKMDRTIDYSNHPLEYYEGNLPGDSSPAFFQGIEMRGARGTGVGFAAYAVSNGEETSPAVELDPLRLKVLRVLYRYKPALDGSRNEPVWDYSLLDFDASGDFALMAKGDALYGWDGENEPVLIGRGFKRAAW